VNVIVLEVFVSLMLAASGVVLFVYSVRQRDFEHVQRMSLFPLDDDDAPRRTDTPR
jgi:cbb3-type cytochrome oxidase maturation protein